MDRGAPCRFEILNYRKDGSTHWVAVDISPVLHPATSDTVSFIAVSTDIDEARRARELIERESARRRRSETLLREILDTLPSGVIVFDAAEKLVLWNRAWEELRPRVAPRLRAGMSLEEVASEVVESGDAEPNVSPADAEPRKRAWIEALLARWRSGDRQLSEIRLAGERWLQVLISHSPSGHMVSASVDVTPLKRAEQELRWRVERDPLTGLLNRESFLEKGEGLLSGRGRGGEGQVTLMLLDIDHFRVINDSFGPAGGDAVLAQVGGRLRRELGEERIVARLHGDEFGVLLEGDAGDRWVAALMNRLGHALGEPIAIGISAVRPKVSFGVASQRAGEGSMRALYRAAGAALAEAKRSRRGRWRVFDAGLARAREEHDLIARLLPEAIAAGDVTIALQPKVRIADRRHLGFEVLARWRHEGRWMPPAAFVSVAEEAGCSRELGEAVLAEACRWLQGLLAKGLEPGQLAFNVATCQLLPVGSAQRLLSIMADHDLEPERFEIEVTESVLLDRSVELIGRTLRGLRAAGVGVALDDFGTGYASLTHLAHLPISAVKMDRSFMRHLPEDGRESTILRSIVRLARDLSLTNCATSPAVQGREG